MLIAQQQKPSLALRVTWSSIGYASLQSRLCSHLSEFVLKVVQVALRWFCSRSLLKAEELTKELIDRIPGKQTDRKTPLGELNWIFTAITDSIAWNMLPRSLFQRLFRQVGAAPFNPLSMSIAPLHQAVSCKQNDETARQCFTCNGIRGWHVT